MKKVPIILLFLNLLILVHFLSQFSMAIAMEAREKFRTLPPMRGFVHAQPAEFPEEIAEVKEAGKVKKSMQLRNEQGELSSSVFLIDKTAHFAMVNIIVLNDSLLLWKDLRILKSRGITDFHIYLNSPGGSGADGLSYADQLFAAWPDFDIRIHATGAVASAALAILVAGEYRTATASTVFMLHKARISMLPPNLSSRDLRANQEGMDLIQTSYNKMLVRRIKLSAEKLEQLMEKITWFDAKQALEWGFIDEIK